MREKQAAARSATPRPAAFTALPEQRQPLGDRPPSRASPSPPPNRSNRAACLPLHETRRAPQSTTRSSVEDRKRSFQIAAGMSNIFVRMRADACENEGRVTIFGPGQAILKPAREKERAAADPALPAIRRGRGPGRGPAPREAPRLSRAPNRAPPTPDSSTALARRRRRLPRS